MIRPPRLSPGDRVAVIAPSGPVPREDFLAGVAKLGERYRLSYHDSDEGLFARQRFLAGSDERRAAELGAALLDDQYRAVLCARGGHGMLRLLPSLSMSRSKIARAARPVVGFSDITALHAALFSAGVASVHGPVLTQLGRLRGDDSDVDPVDDLIARLESPEPPPPFLALDAVAGGRAEGIAVGGNLEVLTRLLGTPFFPSLDGAVLFLEDVGERPYRLDRALTQLHLAGALAHVAAVVLGEFIGCDEKDGSADARGVLVERLFGLGVPVVANAPFGHGRRNRSFIHGGRARVDASRGIVEFLEGGVS